MRLLFGFFLLAVVIALPFLALWGIVKLLVRRFPTLIPRLTEIRQQASFTRRVTASHIGSAAPKKYTGKTNPLIRIGVALFIFGLLYILISKFTQSNVASDQVEQYDMVKRTGSRTEMCVHAGIVSAVYLQAKDDENFRKWEEIKREDCASAGVPNY